MKSLANAICVVAHPDDEVLWFASILKEIKKVIIVYHDCPSEPELGEKRTHAISRLPYEVVSLAIPEAGTYNSAHWQRPRISDYGLSLNQNAISRAAIQAYEQNYYSIKAQLVKHIPMKSTVFTHNPWGEYGHADHVQINRALSDLHTPLRLTLKVSPYISSQSETLAEFYAENTTITPERRLVDSSYANQIANIYKHCGCWTWVDNWTWNEDEYLLPNPLPSKTTNTQTSIKYSPRIRKIPSSVDISELD